MAPQDLLPDFNMFSLGPETAGGDYSRKGFHLGSIGGILRGLALSWSQHLGLRLVLSEIYSCYRRILLGRKSKWDTSGLNLAEVLASCPKVTFPRSCSGNLAYSMCMRALEKERPYLTLADSELFAQAWFQAARFFRGNADTLSCAGQQFPFATSQGDQS
jgi:hypothetical protein